MKGHIRERSPGHWAIVLDAKDADGKRKRRWHSFKGNKRQAQIECARLIQEAQGGAAVDPSRETVGGFIDRFIRDWVAVNVRARTAIRYGELLDHAREHLGDIRLQKLGAADIAGLYAALSRAGKAPRTIRHVHSVLFQALHQAKTWKVVRDNVAELVTPPRVPDRELLILQPEEARKMLEGLRGRPFYLFASLALATGMRRNELLGLRWRDIDLDGRKVTVNGALEETKAFGIRWEPCKTRNGRRTISLPAHAVAELRAHWCDQQEQRLALGIRKAPDDSPALATIEGRYQSPNTVTKAWPRAMKAIGMPAATIHSLRHTHASMLIASGMDVLTISRRLGHSSPTITLKVYGHLIHGTDARAAQIMEAAFGSEMVAGDNKKPEILA